MTLALLLTTISLYCIILKFSVKANALVVRKKAGLLLYSWQCLGVVSHELGHYFFCCVFLHRVTNFSLYSPQPDGQLGFVEHQYNNKSFYQCVGNVFICFGPVFSGVLLSWLLTTSLWPDVNFIHIITAMNSDIEKLGLLAAFTDNANRILMQYLLMFNDNELKFVLWIFLMSSIVNHIMPSKADLRNGLSGVGHFMVLIVLIYFLNFEQIINFANSIMVLLLSMLLSLAAFIVAIQISIISLVKVLKNKEV